MTPAKFYVHFLRWFARVGAQLAVAIGAAVMVGWFLDIAPLKTVLPGLVTMKMNAACGLFAAGASLWMLHDLAPGSRCYWSARALAGFVAVLGGLTLAQDVFGFRLGIDELIISGGPIALGVPHPGRMSPAIALNLLLLGLALLSFKARRPRLAGFAHWLVAPPLFISTLALVGYAYGVNSLYELGFYVSIALHAALLVLVLALAILAADTRHGFALIATSDTAGGVIARQLLPTIPFMLFVLGWICLKGEDAGLYDMRFGLALMVMMSIAVCVGPLAWTALVLHYTDGKRKEAEDEIRTMNAGLELRVLERTQQLAGLSAELTDANKVLEQLSQHDALTGLPNRRHFDIHLAGQIAIARRHKRNLALVMYDVDSFKAFNDRYGHQAGDECLKQVAAVLQACSRRAADLVARYGGEEFAMILPDTDLVGAARIAEEARAAIERLQFAHAHSSATYVSISGGVAALDDAVTTAHQLIAAADEALYEAKHAGRNRIVCVPTEPESRTPLKVGQMVT